jgi:signal transduction histidine kinase
VQESVVVQAPDPRPPTLDPKASAFVVVEIADTGTGIPPEILPKVMDPFFTTKPEGKGTGLGLAICRRIAQEHGGTFSITSEGLPGKGTKCCITLLSTNQSNSTRLFDK